MSIDQRKIIDFVGTRTTDGRCILTISDQLPWGDPDHLLQLQDKINDYLAFIESGEIYESYPDARGREIGIDVVCKYLPPDDRGEAFIEHATKKIQGAGSISTFVDLPRWNVKSSNHAMERTADRCAFTLEMISKPPYQARRALVRRRSSCSR